MTRGGQIRSMRGGIAASTASSRAIASSAPSNSIGGTAISDLALSSQGETGASALSGPVGRIGWRP